MNANLILLIKEMRRIQITIYNHKIMEICCSVEEDEKFKFRG